jgi:DNA-binding transcriptional LysR family regulator
VQAGRATIPLSATSGGARHDRLRDWDWNDLRFLLAIRRGGSVAAAARALKVDPSTVSRRLAALESALGARLASRTPDGLVFTPEGERAAEAAGRIEAIGAELAEQLAGCGAGLEGAVRLSLSSGFTPLLGPWLAEHRARYPGIRVELVTSNLPADLGRREADIALRLFRETRGGLIARKVGTIGWSMFAAPSYVKQCGVPASPTLLEGHRLVGFDDALGKAPGARWLAEHGGGAATVARSDSVMGAVGSVRAAIGLSVLPCFVCIGDSGLLRLTPEVLAESEAFLVTTVEMREVPRVRATLDHLVEFLVEHAAWLDGTLPAAV